MILDNELTICAECLIFQCFKSTNIRCHDLQLLADDGHKCLQMNFACIQKHSFQIYESALVWLPKKSLIRNVYATDVKRVPRVIHGLPNLWGSTVLSRHGGTSRIAYSSPLQRRAKGHSTLLDTVRSWQATYLRLCYLATSATN